jgi:uncharacterized membrane protein YhaH (DUF805 family)
LDGSIAWTDLFWSAGGRLARTPFLIGAAALIAIAAIYEAWVWDPTLHWLTGWFVYPALLFSGACVLSKRLHDRGRSGWWAALILFALVAVWPHAHGFGGLVFSLILIWAAIELGVMHGEDGANRFGPSPLAHAVAA